MPLTITEALAEIKTINKRLLSKRQSIAQYVARAANLRDPLEKDGGSVDFIARERQSMGDLEGRIITIRRGIALANDSNNITIGEDTKSIAEWLTWRREVFPAQQQTLVALRSQIIVARQHAQRSGVAVVAVNTDKDPEPKDWIINLNEKDLAAEIEALETTEGALDGQLSLKNATVTIDI
jgi:hypothetical protein